MKLRDLRHVISHVGICSNSEILSFVNTLIVIALNELSFNIYSWAHLLENCFHLAKTGLTDIFLWISNVMYYLLTSVGKSYKLHLLWHRCINEIFDNRTYS